jgi:hypothetical protein
MRPEIRPHPSSLTGNINLRFAVQCVLNLFILLTENSQVYVEEKLTTDANGYLELWILSCSSKSKYQNTLL